MDMKPLPVSLGTFILGACSSRAGPLTTMRCPCRRKREEWMGREVQGRGTEAGREGERSWERQLIWLFWAVKIPLLLWNGRTNIWGQITVSATIQMRQPSSFDKCLQFLAIWQYTNLDPRRCKIIRLYRYLYRYWTLTTPPFALGRKYSWNTSCLPNSFQAFFSDEKYFFLKIKVIYKAHKTLEWYRTVQNEEIFVLRTHPKTSVLFTQRELLLSVSCEFSRNFIQWPYYPSVDLNKQACTNEVYYRYSQKPSNFFI